jgi:tRNA G18 (ribose-2'-O)-methylase SpoU
MGSLFARPPAKADFPKLSGIRVALHAIASATLAEAAGQLAPPAVLCLGAEREGLPQEVLAGADLTARIPLRPDGPESLNVAMAATVALYEAAIRTPPLRMAPHA